MRPVFAALSLGLLACACGAPQPVNAPLDDTVSAASDASADPMPEVIEEAIEDESRPEADRVLDASRHPAEVLVFSGVERGWRVADLSAGSGYYSRVLSTAVGEAGHVYAQNPIWVAERYPQSNQTLADLAAQRSNLTYIVNELASFDDAISDPLDAVYMVLFYHDTVWAGTDRAAMNQAAFDALRPGGVYLIIDHHAPDGSGLSHVQGLHRIDSANVLEEVTQAGFILERSSDMLANEQDPRDISIFSPSIRRQTDRFVYLFRKPEEG